MTTADAGARGQWTPAPPHSVGAVLAQPGFKGFWVALGLSSLGDWAGLLALTAMANELAGPDYGDRNFAIGGVLLLRVLPALLIGPLGGYLADHLDRRWVLVIGDVVRALVFVSIPLVGTLTWLLIATVLVEIVNMVWLPTKDATIPDLVPAGRLEAANRLVLATTYGSAAASCGAVHRLVVGHRGAGIDYPVGAVGGRGDAVCQRRELRPVRPHPGRRLVGAAAGARPVGR
jgi:dTMP kinase